MVMGKAIGATFIALVTAVALIGSSCSVGGSDRIETRSTSDHRPSSGRRANRLCQPFPDRLLDNFLAAYNERDLDTLEALVTDETIEDVVTAAYAGSADFDGVAGWAEASWEADDRMRSVGYSAFYPTKRGFQMMMTRRSDALEAHGIGAVTTTLDAISRGCTIESLEMSGIVQAKGEPCAFYRAFAQVEDVAANEPSKCRDGSGDHARTFHVVAWSGEQVLVWGGDRGGHFTYGDLAMDGLAFDPLKRRWERIPPAPLADLRPDTAMWTGRELVFFGPKSRGFRALGAAYDPRLHMWRRIAFPFRRWVGFEGVWTGSEVILWGGPDHSRHPRRRGAIYDPAADSWRKTAPAPISGRWSHSVVWTGEEMIAWGGGNADSDLADGAAYDPATDTWRKIAPAPISARQWLPLVWTGLEMIAWGGSSASRSQADGAAYDPLTDSWRILPAAPIKARHHHSATWTGTEVIVFGGYNYHRSFSSGAAYDPVSDSWRRIARAPLAPRCCHSAVWTNAGLFVFGGSEHLGDMALGDGALYDPAADRWKRMIPEP